ncbi:protein mono-ADP-ribosyltransferase PARP14-like [Haliotis cracherodii]|uniref:protein mono-ADP-ribosyltransferase PARP14-like n=1 Tax=Haliotis cracherodii TaxID=6455 RepID=UPI0039EC9D42
MSSGRFLSLGRNPVFQMQAFLEDDSESFVIIPEEGETGDPSSLSDPHTHRIPLSPVQLQYLKSKPAATQIVSEKLNNEGFRCKFDFNASTVTISTSGSKSDDQALQMIKESIVEMDFSTEEIPLLKEGGVEALPAEGPGNLEVLIVRMGSVVKVVALADAAIKLGHSLQRSRYMLQSMQPAPAQDNGSETILMSEDCANYLTKYKWTEMKALIKRFSGVVLTRAGNSMEVKGPRMQVRGAVQVVNDEVERVSSFPITLGPGISILAVANVSQRVSEKHQCIIAPQQQIGFMEQTQSLTLDSLRMSMSSAPRKTKVKVVMNALERQKADVIVNTTNEALKLGVGRGVSWCILQAAGERIQEQLTRENPKGIGHGEVAESGPGNIKTCKAIYHGSLPGFPVPESPNYQQEEDNCFKWMVSLVFNCLIKASGKGYKTIAFPALGTGFLKYPVQHVVQLMYKAIRLFNDDKRSGSIREIFIVILPETQLSVKQLFLAHRHTYKLKTKHLAVVEQFHEVKKSEQKRKCEIRVQIGNTLLQVVQGSVGEAREVTEAVLVLWNDTQIENVAANPGLTCTDADKTDWQCSSYVSELNERICAHDSTSLPFATLLHSYCPNNQESTVVDAIAEGIRNAAKIKCNTITVPLAPSGEIAKRPNTAAQMVFKGVKKASDTVCVVTVIIPDEHVFQPFSNRIAELTLKQMQVPADIDKSPVAVDLWEKTYADIASQTQTSRLTAMVVTIADSKYLVTSDSEDKNKMAADDFKKELIKELPRNTSHSYIRLG